MKSNQIKILTQVLKSQCKILIVLLFYFDKIIASKSKISPKAKNLMSVFISQWGYFVFSWIN